MPLIIPTAPAPSIEALRGVLPSLANGSSLSRLAPQLSAALNESPAAMAQTPGLSYRVYTLGLSDLAAVASNGLRNARLSSWRHTLSFNGETVTADVSVDSAGARHEFSSLNASATAESAQGMQSSVDALRKEPAILAGSFEMSLLQIPALGVRAIWLHDVSAKAQDVLVPVAPIRSELVAGRHYSVSEFSGLLQAAAAKILANDDPRKGAA